MRSRTMTGAIAAVAALAALVSAGTETAFAGPHVGCRIRLEAPAPRLVQFGETALLYGRIKCRPGSAAAGEAVNYFARVAGAAAAPIGTSSSDTLGRFQLTTPTLEKNTSFFVTAGGAVSAHRLVKVSPKVTIAGPPEGSILYTGRGPILHPKGQSALPSKVTFTGQVSPKLAGAEVVLQRENAIRGEEWHRIGHAIVGPTGAYSIEHTFSVPGPADIRVLVRRTKFTARGVSESLSYEIVQAQNPDLTIFSSKNPLQYGEPVTISGAYTAGEGVKLTLMAKPRPLKKFIEVATTTTGAGGAYTFAAQTPLQNTIYKVVAAGAGPAAKRNSAALFEGVKYLLTATPSTTSVHQGSPILFSGTVSPAAAGHVIYLQVLDLQGAGFHILDVGTVGPAGAYSISYIPFVPATRKYRVRIPGDPAHEGTSSALFPITTTASPGSLKTEPPSNSTPPGEGH
jgi:hypothetical protein